MEDGARTLARLQTESFDYSSRSKDRIKPPDFINRAKSNPRVGKSDALTVECMIKDDWDDEVLDWSAQDKTIQSAQEREKKWNTWVNMTPALGMDFKDDFLLTEH